MKDKNVTVAIKWNDYSSENLDARIRQLKKVDHYVALDPATESIQFLRGVWSRASLALPALYVQIASQLPQTVKPACWEVVRNASVSELPIACIDFRCRASSV
jgi:hypothetical protein